MFLVIEGKLFIIFYDSFFMEIDKIEYMNKKINFYLKICSFCFFIIFIIYIITIYIVELKILNIGIIIY